MQRKSLKTKRAYTVAHSSQMLEMALECLRKKTMSSYEAEKCFGIPRRTLLDKLKHKHDQKVGRPTRLHTREENEIIKVLIAAADFGSPLSLLDLRCMVHKYLQKNGRDIFNGKIPGEKWAYGFLKRHRNQLSLRVTSNIKKVRAEKSCNEMREYFTNLKESLLQVPKENILNYDETNLSDDPGKSKCIVKRGTKYPERIINHSKGCISIMFAITADGKMLTPYVVYKSKHVWSQWVTGGPPLTRYNHSPSGWFDANLFEDWIVNIVVPWATKLLGPKVVLGDNLASHLNPEIVALCEQHNIRFVLLPTNSTHLTQPLDVCVYGPLKRIWRKILTQFKIENPSEKALNKCRFPSLLMELMEELSKRENNVVSAFATTGIYPFNPEAVLKRLPDYNEAADYGIDRAVIDYLSEIRTPKRLEKQVRNKKLKIQPGKSVTANDFAFSVNLDFKINSNKARKLTHNPKTASNNSKIIVTSNILLKDPEKLNEDALSKTSNQKNFAVQDENKENATEILEPSSVFLQQVGIGYKDKSDTLYYFSNNSEMSDEDVSIKKKVITPKKKSKYEDEDTDEEGAYSLHDSSYDYEEKDDYSEEDDNYREDEMTLENDEKIPCDNESNVCKAPSEGNYLLARFLSKRDTKYYVGQVIQVEDQNNFKLKFLRHKGQGKFVWPLNEDYSFINKTDIEAVLPEPITARRGTLTFDMSKWFHYNIG